MPTTTRCTVAIASPIPRLTDEVCFMVRPVASSHVTLSSAPASLSLNAVTEPQAPRVGPCHAYAGMDSSWNMAASLRTSRTSRTSRAAASRSASSTAVDHLVASGNSRDSFNATLRNPIGKQGPNHECHAIRGCERQKAPAWLSPRLTSHWHLTPDRAVVWAT